MFKLAKKNQNQLKFNILRYMKRIHTCDLRSLIQCNFIFGEKYDTEQYYYLVDCNRAVPV